MANSSTPKRVDYRSAVTGKFITERKAQQTPRESVRETRQQPNKKGGK